MCVRISERNEYTGQLDRRWSSGEDALYHRNRCSKSLDCALCPWHAICVVSVCIILQYHHGFSWDCGSAPNILKMNTFFTGAGSVVVFLGREWVCCVYFMCTPTKHLLSWQREVYEHVVVRSGRTHYSIMW